jgi:hypothetical protein
VLMSPITITLSLLLFALLIAAAYVAVDNRA